MVMPMSDSVAPLVVTAAPRICLPSVVAASASLCAAVLLEESSTCASGTREFPTVSARG